MRLVIALSLLFAAPAWAHDPAAAEHGGHEKAPSAAIPVQKTADGAVYGARLADALPAAVSLDRVVAEPEASLGKAGAFSGRITQVCQKQGCWLVLSAQNGEFARVFMHDHAFSVPKDASGEAVVYGTLGEKKLTAEEVAHLKKDGAAAPAARELQIDATSVVIRAAG
jgi:hypothetical protein